jgi:circadian clock protein KaiC
MKYQMGDSSLIQTGIKGLDEVLLGGIPRGNVILLQGATGSGKTLTGIEIIYRELPNLTSLD